MSGEKVGIGNRPINITVSEGQTIEFIAPQAKNPFLPSQGSDSVNFATSQKPPNFAVNQGSNPWHHQVLDSLMSTLYGSTPSTNTQTDPELVLKTGIDENSNIYQSIEGLNLAPGQYFSDDQLTSIQGYFKEQEGLVPQREQAAQKYRQENNVQSNFNIPNYDSNLAQNIVNAAKNSSAGKGRCYEGVSPAIAQIEQTRNLQDNDRIPHGGTYGTSAADFDNFFTDQPGMLEKWGLQQIDLKQNKEMTSPYQIPDGSICVWERGSGGTSAAHGHISVASQGNQYYGLGADGFWSMPDYVFVPIKK